MVTLDDSIRQAIQTHLARSQLSESKLGAFAVGNPSLVPRLKAGGTMRLDTADQLLRYMNEAPIGPTFRTEVEAFLSETGIGERKFGSAAVRDPSFVTKLRNGASPRLSTIERVQAWMHANKDALLRAAIALAQAECRESSAASSTEPGAQDTPAATTEKPRSEHGSAIEETTPAQAEPKRFLSAARGRGPAHDLAPHAPSLSGKPVRWPPFVRFGIRIVYGARRSPGMGLGDAPWRNT